MHNVIQHIHHVIQHIHHVIQHPYHWSPRSDKRDDRKRGAAPKRGDLVDAHATPNESVTLSSRYRIYTCDLRPDR